MGRYETYPDANDGAESAAESAGSAAAADGESEPRPADPGPVQTRPGTGVVRPGTGVVRPGIGVVASAGAVPAKARAIVPDTPETPMEPIHVVLPVIPVKPAKQGFLDRLVAPKPKKKKKDKDSAADNDVAGSVDAPSAAAGASAPSAAPPTPSAAPPAPTSPPAPVSPPAAPPRFEAPAPPPVVPPPPPPPPPPPAPSAPGSAPPVADGPAPPVPARPDARPPDFRPPMRPAAGAPPASPTRGIPPAGPWAPDAPGPTRPGHPGPAGPRRGPRRPPPPPAGDFHGGRRPARRPPGGSGYARDSEPDWAEESSRRGSGVRSIGRRWWIAGAVLLVIVGLVGGGLAARTGRSQPRWLAAADVGSAAPLLGDLGADAPRPSPAGMAAKIQLLLADGRLGGQVTASVVDAASGEPIYDLNGGRLSVPASTAKLATAAAVLHARGPAYRLATRVVEGSSPGEVVIIGGGDPTLAVGATASYPGAARLDKLAEQVTHALGGTAPTRVVVDSSLFVGPTFGPGWFAQDAKDGFIANITALMTDGARRDPKRIRPPAPRYPRPDLAAGQLLARQLGLPVSAVTIGTAPPGSRQLGEVLSPPVSRLVEMMISESDNMVAEALARQVALARGEAASFAGGVVATRDVLVELGIPIDGYGLVDGSGMSHNNRVSAQFLTAILAHAVSHDQPQLRSIVSGLPVAAYSGTLAERYRTAGSGGAAKGVVRAKTGTLTGVNSLAGVVVDADGRLLAFSIIADKTTNTPQAQVVMDRIAAAIASCGC